MPVNNVSEVVRFGLNYERLRLEAASNNIAMANVAIAPGERSPLLQVTTGDFAQKIGMPSLQALSNNIDTGADNPAIKTVFDPKHPLADSNGMVRFPNVEPSREMTTLVSATRAYEANVRAFNMLKGMNAKALEIGGR